MDYLACCQTDYGKEIFHSLKIANYFKLFRTEISKNKIQCAHFSIPI